MINKDNQSEFVDKVARGLEESYRKMIQFKIEKNSPVVVVENGKILKVNPKDLPPTIKYKR
jgi:imidazolonepropionase-like amidohydrolase